MRQFDGEWGSVLMSLVWTYLNIDTKPASYLRSLLWWMGNCKSTGDHVTAHDSLLFRNVRQGWSCRQQGVVYRVKIETMHEVYQELQCYICSARYRLVSQQASRDIQSLYVSLSVTGRAHLTLARDIDIYLIVRLAQNLVVRLILLLPWRSLFR